MSVKKVGIKDRIKDIRYRTALLVTYDITAIMISYFLALWFRFDCLFSAIPSKYLIPYVLFTPVYALICVIVFYISKLYNMIWRFVGYKELSQILLVSACTSAAHIIGITIIFGRMPITYYIIGMGMQAVLIAGIRVSYRLILLFTNRREKITSGGRILIIGAGESGRMIIKSILSSDDVHDIVAAAIDDDETKHNRYIEGVKVVGGRDDILDAVNKYNINKIFLTIPSISAEDKRDILNICSETDCELKQLPGISQLVEGKVTVSDLKNVSVEDLLGREPIRTDMTEVYRFLNNKVVLVTGGGGSIGSELCRQVAAHKPKKLIIFDIYENNAYDIQNELKYRYPDLDLVVLIGSVRDSRRVFKVFEEYRPDVVYHAAAHKHVPLMEGSPCEAIKNNTIGTYKTAFAAMTHGCKRFVLISTDKAVNPTNIMGASKRLCEMIIQAFSEYIKLGKADKLPQFFTHEDLSNTRNRGDICSENICTEFVAVRFGNVLGSNGSVIPLFKKQIERGGPVTVTDKEIIRYFMTIPEAVGLVLLAGVNAHGGEIFVLDMGSPMKIDTLARNLIKMYGLKPDVDIKIEYTGLRPGEKLYEEKLMAEEGLKRTENKLIHIGRPIPFEVDEFLVELNELMDAAYKNKENIRELVMKAVSTYRPADSTDIVKETITESNTPTESTVKEAVYFRELQTIGK